VIAFTIEGAAAETPFGEKVIREAIRQGDLLVHYRPDGGQHPIILADDLIEWIRSLPTEKRPS